jgi:hypothetical protein
MPSDPVTARHRRASGLPETETPPDSTFSGALLCTLRMLIKIISELLIISPFDILDQ